VRRQRNRLNITGWTWSRVVGCVQRPWLKFWCQPHVVQPSVTAPFAVAGPRAWNSLPADLRFIRTFSVFKRHLKHHFFNFSFLWDHFATAFTDYVNSLCSCLWHLPLFKFVFFTLHNITFTRFKISTSLQRIFNTSLKRFCLLFSAVISEHFSKTVWLYL